MFFNFTQKIVNFIQLFSQPGPARTVGERSLRKIFVRGDRGSNLAEGASFQTAKRT